MNHLSMSDVRQGSSPTRIDGLCPPSGAIPGGMQRAWKAQGRWAAVIQIIVLFLVLPLQAQASPAGSGTEADPYQIATFDDLLWIANNSSSWSSSFIQTADIDASSTQTTPWPRIGTDFSASFDGSYNGNNHVISGLHLEYDQSIDVDDWGLFGYIGASGSVSNLGVVNLSGSMKSGSGSVVNFGGLAGVNSGVIADCYTTGSINGPNSPTGGGLVGENYSGTISSSYSTCAVVADHDAGGLVGYNYSGSIDNTYATGSVTCTDTSDSWGGLVGSNVGSISNSYATGTIDNASFAGAGGFCGQNTGTISNCFWNTETSGTTTSAGGAGLTTAQMQTRRIFTDAGWDFDQESANGTDDIWGMNLTDNNGLPFLSLQGYTSYGQVPAGSGTSQDPYLIASLDNLYWLSQTKSAWGSSFEQTADIDASSTSTWSNGEGFSPIGTSTSNFTGSYDGQGHTMSSLTINKPTQDHVGLFGYTSGSAAISNLVLASPEITGNADVGAFVGIGGGQSIDNCAGTGVSVTGNGDNVGGVIGYCDGPLSMTGVHTTGSVTQNPSASSSGTGGLVGRTGSGGTATITSCSSTATVQGNEDTGGLVGYMASGSIDGCHQGTGTVSSSSPNRGGLVGQAGTIEISNSYSTGPISADSENADYAGGLVGRVDSITISQSYSTGSISGGIRDSNGYLTSGTSHGGGLVARIGTHGEITDCHSEATIEVRGNGGGLVGDMNTGSITRSSYSSGTVSSNDATGGLVGQATSVAISQSYSTGHVGGGVEAGGLVGSASGGSITDCYATGNLAPAYSQSWDWGGFVGLNTATITNCYSTGLVEAQGGAAAGGFAGTNTGTITNCFWDTGTSGKTTSAGGTGKTTAEMKTASTFTDAGWDFATIWSIDAQHNSGYPSLLWSLSAPSPAILYAKPAAAGTGDCSSWTNACTLQTALGGAVSGDEIWVMIGTYSPGSNRTDTFQLKNGVGVYGGFDGTETARSQRNPQANVTILTGDVNGDDGPDFANNGENNYHVVTASGEIDATAVLDGFTVSGGNADGANPNNLGGGMYNDWNASPTLNDVTFSGDSAQYGGGMYNGVAGNSSLSNVTFSGNSAAQDGGGMYSDWGGNLTLSNVTFSGNSAAQDGGGMYNNGNNSGTLSNVTFSGNSAENGGGMYNYQDNSGTLTNVTFSGNQADAGGGMYNWDHSNPALDNVTFSGNSAENGGGMVNTSSSPTLDNVTFSANSARHGGGIYNTTIGGGADLMSNPQLNNVTFSGNSASWSGGGMYSYYSNPVLSNVILWGDTAGEGGSEIYFEDDTSDSVTLTITDSVVQGGCPTGSTHTNITCTNVITGDPMLGPLADNGGLTQTYALLPGSSAIDAGGVNSTCEATDQRGVPRPQGAGCDIGAYEFAAPADLRLALSQVYSPALTGVDVSLESDIVNDGPGQADVTEVDVVVDPGLVVFDAWSSPGTCTTLGQMVTCSLGTLASGDSATVTVTVQGSSGGSFTNTAEASSPMQDPDPTDNGESAMLTLVDPLECDAANDDANPTPDDIAPMVGQIFGTAAPGPADCNASGAVDAVDLALVIALSQP